METVTLVKFAAAFIFVISSMLLLSYILKRAGFAGPVAVPGMGRRKRLRVVEHMPLDQRRRLVLVRRDDREHLLVLGPGGETVVETGIPAADNVVELDAGEKTNAQGA